MLTNEQKVFLCVGLALVIFYIAAFTIGAENKAKWFHKRQKSTIFTRRGFLGEHINFGYPVTIEGYVTTLCICTAIVVECFIVSVWL